MAEFTIAFDQGDNQVNIDNADKNEKYYCVNCGQQMIPVQGEQREWHYRHKEYTSHCNHDEWLHKTLVQILYDRLYSGDLLKIECPNNDFIDNRNISVEKEKKYNDFRPDILLQKGEEVYFLEVAVSHCCSDSKIASGIKIIEIYSDNDKVIEELASAEILLSRGSNYNIGYYNFPENTSEIEKPALINLRACAHKPHTSFFLLHRDKTYNVFGHDNISISQNDMMLIGVDAQSGFAENIGKAYAYKKGLLDRTDLSMFEQTMDILAVINYLNMEEIFIRQSE